MALHVNSKLADFSLTLREAVTLSVLRRAHARVTGEGDFGEIITDGKPSKVLTAGFLMPSDLSSPVTTALGISFDASSPTNVPTLGLTFQVDAARHGNITVRPRGCIYVRVLPTTAELLAAPVSFGLSRDLRRRLRQVKRQRIEEARLRNAEIIGREGDTSAEWRRIRAEAAKSARDEVLSAIGGPLGANIDATLVGEESGVLSDAEEPQDFRLTTAAATGSETESANLIRSAAVEARNYDPTIAAAMEDAPVNSTASEEREDAETLVFQVSPGMTAAPRDDLVEPADIPPKWLRLTIDFPVFEFDPSWEPRRIKEEAQLHGNLMAEAIRARIAAWQEDNDADRGGALWAIPQASLRGTRHRLLPSHIVRWDDFLQLLRADRTVPHPCPDLKPQLEISVAVDPAAQAQRTVRVVFSNRSTMPPNTAQGQQLEHGLFLAGITCEMDEQQHRAHRLIRIQPSYRWNEWLNHHGVGLNCGITAQRGEGRIVLSSTHLPMWLQPRIVPYMIDPPPETARLAQPDGGLPVLEKLAEEYRDWITRIIRSEPWAQGLVRGRDDDLIDRERQAFERVDLPAWRSELGRIELGIAILRHAQAAIVRGVSAQHPEALPMLSWRAMNESFRRNGLSIWHLFQVAFVLGQLPGIVSRVPYWSGRDDLMNQEWLAAEDGTVTLLYFPTGGGKSESFFGAVILSMFIDRLRGKRLGVTAMIRYPLRLLTAQQANRFASAAAAAELVRREWEIPGEPFQVGFWVGSGNTPNNPLEEGFVDLPEWGRLTEAEERQLRRSSREYRNALRWKRLTECPFCHGNQVALRRRREANTQRLAHACLNVECAWNVSNGAIEPLPFHVMDTDIYGYAPAVVLGTIDKLAMIGHSATTIARVFGMLGFAPWQYVATTEHGTPRPGYGRLVHPTTQAELQRGPQVVGCRPLFPAYADGASVFNDPYPTLAVQDETHLLEQSLGTFSGLFETTFETALTDLAPLLGNVLTSRLAGRPRRTKIIAASATVSEPQRQVLMIYQRRVSMFPHPGPELYDSFFARLQQPDPADRGREALLDSEVRTPIRRVYVSAPTNGKPHTSATVSLMSALHLTLSELMDWLLCDDARVREAARTVLLAHVLPGALEPWHSASVRAATHDDLTECVDLLRILLCYVTNKKGGDNIAATINEFVDRDHRRAGINLGETMGVRTGMITGAIEMERIQAIVDEASPRWQAGEPFDRERDFFAALRGIVATSAISHGVDIDRLNLMVFTGLPSDISEYIQASSRIGRAHVGLSILVPTPQHPRDVHVVEIHEVFHRFLERMVQPAAVDRWGEQAINRVIASAVQVKLCAVDYLRRLSQLQASQKFLAMPSDLIDRVQDRYREAPVATIEDLSAFMRRAVGLDDADQDRRNCWPAAWQWYSELLVSRIADFLRRIAQARYTGSRVRTFFEDQRMPLPMMSLRDVDESGTIRVAARGSNARAINEAVAADLMRRLRGGDAAWGEGEGDSPDTVGGNV